LTILIRLRENPGEDLVDPDSLADRFDFLQGLLVEGGRYDNLDDFLRHREFPFC
jgi:hypothetical protein